MLTDEIILKHPIPRPGKAAAKLYDAGGLLLLVGSSGSRLWRLKYRLGGRENSCSLGAYPLVPIPAARAKAAAAKKLIASGVNPTVQQRLVRSAVYIASTNTFDKVGCEFLALDDTKAERTADKHEWLHGLLQPLHKKLLTEIKAPDLIKVLRGIEATGKREAARRCGQFAGRVFRFAIQSGYCELNAAADLRGALKPVKTESHPGITDPILFGRLMREIDEDEYAFVTVRHALQLTARVFLRSWELRGALWREIDFKKHEWRVPESRMKMKGRGDHLVPLSKQAISILERQRDISGTGELVFPGARSGRPISDAALGVAIKRLVYLWIEPVAHVPHGFRTSASTMLHELGHEPAVIELQLAHAKAGKVSGIYDKSQRVADRKLLMQAWSDYIDEIKL